MDLPARDVNILSAEMTDALCSAIARVIDDPVVKGVILTSAKRVFMAGGDLELLSALDLDGDPRAAYAAIGRLTELLRRLETSGKPTVAALTGSALGGGLEVALGCHYRIAADDPTIEFGFPEVTLGLLPGGGGTQRLPRLLGAAKALPLLLEGTRLTPAAALAAGVVHCVVTRDAVLTEARRWLASDEASAVQPWDAPNYRPPGGTVWSAPGSQLFYAANAQTHARTSGNYPAQQAILSCVFEGLQVPIETGQRIELSYFVKLLRDQTSRNMIRGVFGNRQAADKLVRRPPGVARGKVARLGVLGAGLMGSGIAQVAANAGIQVVLIDRDETQTEAGRQRIATALTRRVQRGQLAAAEQEAMMARITATTDYAKLADCDFVVEAVFEDRAIKADVTTKAEFATSAGTIIGSNTSTLPITGLALAAQRPAQFIGVHFFSPVERMPLVEVIVGEATSEETLARTLDFARQIRKTPIVVNDAPGFYTSRTFGTFLAEGLYLLLDGVQPALIENAARLAGMPVGPLTIADEVGIDVNYRVIRQFQRDLGSAFQLTRAHEVSIQMHELGRLGRKTRAGFFEYADGGSKRLWRDLAELYPVSSEQPAPGDVQERLLSIQSIEAIRCLEAGVVGSAADADLGALLGWGFPAYTGGPLAYVDTVGAAVFLQRAERLAARHGERFEPPQMLRRLAASGGRFHDTPEKVAAAA
jgi:3-hydroxyacyl-CoA dehydrogenase/enoyl-CoA hydratase/3-hydroxybutyryl-CoA epimerase